MRTADEIRGTAPLYVEASSTNVRLQAKGDRGMWFEQGRMPDGYWDKRAVELAQEWGLPAITSEYHGNSVLYDPPDLRAERDALAAELDGYRHKAVAMQAMLDALTVPCPDCAAIPHKPGTVAAACGKPGCYAGRVNPLRLAGDGLATEAADAAKVLWAGLHDKDAKALDAALSAWWKAVRKSG